MHIGMIAPLEIRVPPVAYGGTELVVSLLTEELVRRGHDVTLFASGDSQTAAELVSVSETSLRGTERHKGVLELLNVTECLAQADRFDIIHNHTCLEGMATAVLVRTPILTTIHGHLGADLGLVFKSYRRWYNTVSHSSSSLLPPKDRFAGVIHNAIDSESYPFNDGPRDDYLLYLSRISPEKGAHIAIDVARGLGRKLIIAGNIDAPDREFFETEILPRVDGDLIEYVGEADYCQKRDLMSRALCLLAPIVWEEPFGLFMIEAMACGTPVVVFRRGSAPEVVRHGITGFIVDTVDEMTQAVKQVKSIDPQACRAHVERNFNVSRMVDDYLAAYAWVIDRERGHVLEGQMALPLDTLLRWPVHTPAMRPFSQTGGVQPGGPSTAARDASESPRELKTTD